MIRKLLDLSTAHVSEETSKWIAESVAQAEIGIGGFYSHIHPVFDTGWFMWVNLEHARLPNDLRKVFEYAAARDCDYVLMDADGDVLDDLPTFDW